jgi:predicted TIM-barrel fold metal-dependent hydrolase
MKSSSSWGFVVLAVMLGWAVGTIGQQPATNRPVSGPFSHDELERFRAIGAIDVHAHVFAPDQFVDMLEKLNLHIVDILVVDDMSTPHRDLDTQRKQALNVVHASHGYAKLCTSFDPYSFDRPDYARTVIRGLDEDFAKGAIAVKLWKNVGMEIKEASGHYLMADNPVFKPIYRDIATHNKTLVAHLADPDSGWQPPNPASPDYSYYNEHPSAYMYGKKGVPSKEEILRARDNVLEQNPNLRVVGAHLGSMESNLAELGRHLDMYPNFAVDMAARMPYLEMQPRATMVAFITKYQDRLIYGTDIDFNGGADEKIHHLEAVYADDWRYFATSDTIDYKGKPVEGLHLPEPVLRKIYHENAAKWFPGVLDSAVP